MSRFLARERRRRALIEERRVKFLAEGHKLLAHIWAAPTPERRFDATSELLDLFDRIAASGIRLAPLVDQLFGVRPPSGLAAEDREEIEAVVTGILREHLSGLSIAEIQRRRNRWERVKEPVPAKRV